MVHRPDRVAHWASVLQQWQRSGLTKAAFCRRQGVSLASFINWLYTPSYRQAVDRLLADSPRSAPRPGSPTPRLVPVVIQADDPVPVAILDPRLEPALQVLLASGRRVAVRPGFDPDTLACLVATLETHS